MAYIVHCPCGKSWKHSERTGHCAACHETFVGLGAFDAHRVGDHAVGRGCALKVYSSVSPSGKTSYGHWQDDKGYWHHGKKLTKEEVGAIFGKAN